MYDGTNYQGWQIQKDGRTVQGIIENAFRNLSEFDRKIRVNGSGRTDAGVHALGQVAHVDFDTNLNILVLKNALNARLPEDCRIISIEQVNKIFILDMMQKKDTTDINAMMEIQFCIEINAGSLTILIL